MSALHETLQVPYNWISSDFIFVTDKERIIMQLIQ